MARESRKNLDTAAAPVVAEPVFYHAAAYTRLSSDDKKKRGDSLETQRNIIENFIATVQGIQLSGVYTDNQKTGTSFDRPGFQKMLADCESGKINCIIVKDLSRFGRNAIDAGYYLEKYLPALGVRFVAVTDDYDSNDGDGGIMLPLKNVIAESYALDISRKCRAVQRQNIADGRFVGRLAPYGYEKSPKDCHRLIPDEETAPTVRRIFEWAAAGIGPNEIARRLTAEGVAPPSRYKYDKGLNKSEKLRGNDCWKGSRVKAMLSDRVYIGDMVQGKTRRVGGQEVNVDKSEWVCVPDTHEPVVSREVFERVQGIHQAVYERAKGIVTVPYTPNALKGKVICAKCGNPMHRHRQNKDGTYWFRCESQCQYGKGSCVQVSVKEADLKAEIFTMLNVQAKSLLGRFIGEEQGDAQGAKAATSAELREINQGMDRDGRLLRSLYESLASGLITQSEYTQMKAEYEAKIAALSERADEIRNRGYEKAARADDHRSLAEAVEAAISSDRLTEEITGRLVEGIHVNPDKSFEIRLRFQDEFEGGLWSA